MPTSMEMYYRQTSQAVKYVSTSFVYFNMEEKDENEMNFIKDTNNIEVKENHISKLDIFWSYCKNTNDCRRMLICNYFGEERSRCTEKEEQCDNCTQMKSNDNLKRKQSDENFKKKIKK